MITFDAHFDGEHLCPVAPISLPTNVRLRVTVEESATVASDQPTDEKLADKQPLGFFGQLFGGETIEGPEDWAKELDHYLYGTPKRGDDPTA